jgi:hypothetical protein
MAKYFITPYFDANGQLLVGHNGGFNGLVGCDGLIKTTDHTSADGHTGLIGQTCLDGLIGPVGQISHVEQTCLISLVGPMNIFGQLVSWTSTAPMTSSTTNKPGVHKP